jgi:hypothetical protein
VFEQAPSLRLGGAAATLWSNGTGILNELKVPLDGASPLSMCWRRGTIMEDCSSGSMSPRPLRATVTPMTACRAGGCSNGWQAACPPP